ncbi:MAG: PIG-L family deacetylase [Candidatus Omnitrophica bacterium]|nr:PIG-L family deacetylase [Candidatus Omnitrophota bacterium]MDD5238185.1 PIG-L family deacetylase [Candidatus Omnitrophota bacterium]
MLKKIFLILPVLLLFIGPANSFSGIDINNKDRILILAPHPDDETIGCAGIIQDALKVGAEVKVMYLTNGDHNQLAFIVYEKRLTLRKGEFLHMGEVRHKEAVKAMKLLGLGENNLIFLGYPDWGTFAILTQYWQTKKPYKSWLTRVSSVPYKANLSYGAPYTGDSILTDLESVLLKYKPNKIFVSHPADTNRDHHAFYIFLQIALQDLKKKIPNPEVYPYLVHCAGWPLPRHYHPELSLAPPSKFSQGQINWLEFKLTQRQLENKHQAMLCYKSQTESSAFYLLSFVRKNELFGDYPDIELKKKVSTKERGVSFFGFSNMFAGSEFGVLDGLDLSQGQGVVSYTVLDDCLLIRIGKLKQPDRRLGAIFYIFGFSQNKPFAQMPKIRIITRYNRFKVFDKRKLIKPLGVSLTLSTDTLILKVPLSVLGNPEFILTSVKAYKGILPPETSGFRKIKIK